MSQQNSSIPVLPATGFLRLSQVLTFIPVSEAAWYQGMAENRFPKPISLGKRTAAYRVSDIRKLIESFSEGKRRGE